MVRHAVEVGGATLSAATAWQALYQCQLLRAYGPRWIGREPGGLPASVIPHVFLAEASAIAAARALERAAIVEAAADHADRWRTPDRWRLRRDVSWWRAEARWHLWDLAAHCEAVCREVPEARGLPPVR